MIWGWQSKAGMAWHGQAGHGEAGQSKARQARQGRHGILLVAMIRLHGSID